MVAFGEVVSVLELIVYIPIFLATLFIIFRHGFKRQLGWIYLTLFCLIRVVGAGFKIASVHNPTNVTDAEWGAILNSVGLSPLLLASMGLLKRVTDQVSTHIRSNTNILPVGGIVGKLVTSRATATSRRSRIIQVAQLPTTIALILCIVGGTDASSSNPSDVKEGPNYIKAGVIIFFLIWLLLATLVVITIKDVSSAPKGERRIYFVVTIAIPLLAIRLLWSLISAFGHSRRFSVTDGSAVVLFFMAVLEEFTIVCMYVFAGLTADV
jgi:hypothetical protein